MEAYRREVEKMKQLQDGEVVVVLASLRSHRLAMSFSLKSILSLVLSSLFLKPQKKTDAQRNAETQQKLIQQQHENEMVLKVRK